MSGFPTIQAAYAERRVVVYPVGENKLPAINNYMKVGAPASAQLAMKFAEIQAAGFCAGSRNRLTVVDIDSPDDRLVAEVQRQFGATPLQVITPSGGRHLYYRHNGETRRIRPLPDVDILGAGNVVAALSRVPKGAYSLERGTLDDLDRLPPLRQQPPAKATSDRVPEGQRNNALFEFCRATVARCDGFNDLLDAAMTWAEGRLEGGLSEMEITRTASSVWTYRGGRKRIMNQIVEGAKFEALMANPAATTLLVYLQAEQGDNATFMVADGLGEAQGWPRRFVPEARKALLDLGIIECVRPRGDGRPALYRWVAQS